MSPSTTELDSVLASFFNDHLKLRKGLTQLNHQLRGSMRLFLQFTAKTAGKKITRLGLDDLDASAVSSFLNALEGKGVAFCGPPRLVVGFLAEVCRVLVGGQSPKEFEPLFGVLGNRSRRTPEFGLQLDSKRRS